MMRKLNLVASLAFAALGDLEALVPGGLTMEALTHPDSLLNFVRIGRMGSQVGDGVVGTYDLLANDATRTVGAWRRRVQDSMDASMSAQEEFLSMLANTHNLPRRVITAILGLNDSNLDASVEALNTDTNAAAPSISQGPFGGRLQNGLSDFVSNGISAGYRKAFAPLATTMRMKRSFLGLDRPPAPPTEAPLEVEAPEPVTTTETPVPPPATPAEAPAAAPAPTAPANFISFPFYLGQQAPPNSFMPMLTQMAPASVSTTSSVSPCAGEIEQTTKVYIDKFGHLQMTVESPTTVSPSTSTEQEAEGAEAHFSEAAAVAEAMLTDTDLLPEGVFTSDLAPPNFHRIDEMIDSLPFEGKYIADHEGQAVEISATDSNVLKEQLKMQLRNKLWTEWVEEIVASNGAETSTNSSVDQISSKIESSEPAAPAAAAPMNPSTSD